ncbi:MAG: adenylosuccinate lyase [Pseudonocardiaceae bacterium]|nr:adenylosuccinate lyase [Pseudonocardiaceae bacterium]
MADTDQCVVSRCRHERGHITDSRFHGDSYATAESRQIFCDTCRMQRWLDIEVVLAASQADIGVIPADVAEEIGRAADIGRIDLDRLRDEFRATRHSLVPLLRAFAELCPDGTGDFVHFGATTQDVQDTAQVLEMRDVCDLVDRDLRGVLARLRTLAVDHRDTVMIGRTHARPALPTTFGLKVAAWIDELCRHVERLSAMRRRVLVAELHGGVGTMAGFQGHGMELLRAFAARLGLGVPTVAWHTTRDRVAEFVTTLAMLVATLARIADEIRTLGRPEFGEVEEGWQHGQVGSSTMPHKRNPEACEQVVVLARLARTCATLGLEAMIDEHERDSRALRLEWPAVADVSHHALAALDVLCRVLDGLHVHAERMALHVRQAAGELCSEALMLTLASRVGKQHAYRLVYDLSQAAQDNGESLDSCAARCEEVLDHLHEAELATIFDPTCQLGEAATLVDAAVAALDRTVGER